MTDRLEPELQSAKKQPRFQIGLSTIFLLMLAIGVWIRYFQESKKADLYETQIPILENAEEQLETLIQQVKDA